MYEIAIENQKKVVYRNGIYSLLRRHLSSALRLQQNEKIKDKPDLHTSPDRNRLTS